jgi:aspartate carbamoyltransferase catalytic subunit
MKRHLLGIENISLEELDSYIQQGFNFTEVSEREIKKVPALRGKTIINLFLEPSTRTRTSFEIAGKRLSADTINISASGSSTSKGETLLDTAKTLEAMNPDVIVIRHKQSGSAEFLSRYLKNTSIVNAGDGMHEHPSQAILDCLTLQQYFSNKKKKQNPLRNLKIAIVGDIRHSRVARSNIWAHIKFGNEIRLIGPATLVPDTLAEQSCFGNHVTIHRNLIEGVTDCDVIMCLRMQLERMEENFVSSLEEYTNEYFVSNKIVEQYAPNAVILHPGPVNRGVELDSKLINSERSLINTQVNNGVAARMAILFALSSEPKEEIA